MGADLYQNFLGTPATQAQASAHDGEDVERRLARARGKARSEGFADGAASAEATFDRELLAQINVVSEALTHFASDREAADAASIDTLRKILASTLRAFTASLADAALPALVADTVANALAAEMSGAVVVETNAERIKDLQAALAGRDKRLTFCEMSSLAPGAARVVWRGGFDHIDASAAITAGAALLDERLRASGAQNQTGKEAAPDAASDISPDVNATNANKETKS